MRFKTYIQYEVSVHKPKLIIIIIRPFNLYILVTNEYQIQSKLNKIGLESIIL